MRWWCLQPWHDKERRNNPRKIPMTADLEARIKQLESKVQELSDREAIRDLRYRYHEYVNEAQFSAIPDLFTDDGVLDFAHLGKAHGHAEIARFFDALDDKPEV